MHGCYDGVGGATKREGGPGEEFGVFSEVGPVFVFHAAYPYQ